VSARTRRGSAAALAVVLVVLHLWGPRPGSVEPLLGWMPPELAWRLTWVGLAWLAILLWTAGGDRERA
jgi:hypothetical protein